MKNLPIGDKVKRLNKIELVVYSVLLIGSVITASIIGISDNPPGIIFAFIAVMVPIVAWTRTWRKLKSFLILAGVSIVGFFVFAVLHNVFDYLGKISEKC